MIKRMIIIPLLTIMVVSKSYTQDTRQHIQWGRPLAQNENSKQILTCDSNILDQRSPFRFKDQRERLVGIWVIYYINCGRLNSLIDGAGKIGYQIPMKLSKEEKPDLDSFINEIKSFVSSLRTHGDIKELRGWEKTLYCYSKHVLQQFESIQTIITENSCKDALKRIGEYFKNNSDADEKVYSLVLEKTNSVKQKYNLDKWQPSKKESDDFVNTHSER